MIVPDEPREKMLCGSNCISAVSQALCCAGAATSNIPLFEYIARLRFNQVWNLFSLFQNSKEKKRQRKKKAKQTNNLLKDS